MADVTTKIITAAETHDLISLDEAKVMLGIDAADTTGDAQLQMLISQNSVLAANQCNRVFAYETLRETWRCVGPVCCPDGAARIYLTHYPVKADDLTLVYTPNGTLIDPNSYELDEESGKLTIFGGYSNEIVVTYSGGYHLPDECPLDLKQAAGLMVSNYRTQAAAAATGGSGIRMLAHKESRIMYFSPKDMAGGGGTTSTGPTTSASTTAIKTILENYVRYWC
jgi:hypothetical protein